MRELCLKFGWNLLSLNASRILSKIDDIFRVCAGVEDDFDVNDWAGVLDDVLDGLYMP